MEELVKERDGDGGGDVVEASEQNSPVLGGEISTYVKACRTGRSPSCCR